MSDERSESGISDRSWINIERQYDLNYWKKELEVSPETLKEAVAAVGSRVEDVRVYLQERSKN